MKKSQLRQIFKDLKVETDKETEDEVLDAIKKGKIKNNKEAIKKWLKQNTNQPFTNKIKESIKIKNKMKKSQLRQIIREEIKEAVTTDHPSYSAEAKAYALAAAELSNAVLNLDPDDDVTMNRAQVAYIDLGPLLDDYLRIYFGGDTPQSFKTYHQDW